MTSPLRHKLSKKIGKKPSRYCKIYHTGSKKGHKTSIGRKINKRRLIVLQENVHSSENEYILNMIQATQIQGGL